MRYLQIKRMYGHSGGWDAPPSKLEFRGGHAARVSHVTGAGHVGWDGCRRLQSQTPPRTARVTTRSRLRPSLGGSRHWAVTRSRRPLVVSNHSLAPASTRVDLSKALHVTLHKITYLQLILSISHIYAPCQIHHKQYVPCCKICSNDTS